MGSKYILATDPRGYVVEFWQSRWDWIVKKHPDLLYKKVTEDDLKKAIEEPLGGCIYASNKYPDTDLYYTTYAKDLKIRVVVKFVAEAGEIVTAHFYGNKTDFGKIVWKEK